MIKVIVLFVLVLFIMGFNALTESDVSKAERAYNEIKKEVYLEGQKNGMTYVEIFG